MSGRPVGPVVNWTGVILAGGRSQRFGGIDKTRLPLGGRTLLQRAVDALAPLTETCLVVGGATGHDDRVPDRYPGAGPLGGILTALDVVQTSHLLVVAADLPFLSGSLLGELQRAGEDAAVAFVGDPDGRRALCVTVCAASAPDVRQLWSQGARRLRDLEALAPCRTIDAGPDAVQGTLVNVNDPLTYARALEMAEHDCPAC